MGIATSQWRLESSPSHVVREALGLARSAYGNARAHAGADPLAHPLAVAHELDAHGFDGRVVAAGLLHDAVEDGRLTVEAIRAVDPRAAAIVEAMTEDASLQPYEERKRALREQIEAAGHDAAAVAAADKLTKVRELAAEAGSDDGDAARLDRKERKLAHYRATLAMLERAAPGLALVGELRESLDALAPPR